MEYTKTPINVDPPGDTVFHALSKVNTNFTDIEEMLQSQSEIGITEISGGGTDALDGIDGDLLQNGDVVPVFQGMSPSRISIYVLDADSGLSESLPDIVAPDTNPGTKRWILSGVIPRFWAGTAAPTADDDTTIGVRRGDVWRYGSSVWICAEDTESAALWIKLLQTHADLPDAGTNDHAAIDGHIVAANPHGGSASTVALETHTEAANPHNGSASTSDLASHATAAAPHTGHATLVSGRVPDAEIEPWDVMAGQLVRVSDTVLKWQFMGSNHVRLHSDTNERWELVRLASEPTLANDANDMGGSALAHSTTYDVFLKYASATSAQIAVAPWASDSARYAAWATSTLYTIGRRVSESGSYYACAEEHTSGTFATDLAAGKWVQVTGDGNFVGFGMLNGSPVYAASGVWREYRWVGSIRLQDDSGPKFRSNDQWQGIDNLYNSKPRPLRASNSTGSWTYDTASWRESNGGTGQARAYFLCAVTRSVHATGIQIANLAATTTCHMAGAVDSPDTVSGAVGKFITGASTLTGNLASHLAVEITPGWHYLTTLESGSSGTPTYYGSDYLLQGEVS